MAVDDIKFSNNAITTITNNPLLIASTTINVSDGTVFPVVAAPAYAFATLQDATGAYEIVKITTHTAAATTLTVERGADNSTAAQWANGTLIEMRPNIAIFEAIRDHTHDTQYPAISDVVSNVYQYATLSSSGTDLFVGALSTAPATLIAGLRVSFIANANSSGPCSLNLNGLGVKSIKMNDNNNEDPPTNFIRNGGIVYLEYDGTYWRLVGVPSKAINTTSPQTLTNKTLTDPTVTDGTFTSPVINGSVTGTAPKVLLNQKVINIGDWDMDTNASPSAIAHGLTLSKIRAIVVTIRNDSDNGYRDFAAAWNAAQTVSHQIVADATNITLVRATSGIFDAGGFSTTSFNRGWVTIWYID